MKILFYILCIGSLLSAEKQSVYLPLEKEYIEKRYKKRDPSKKVKIVCILQNFGFVFDKDMIALLPKGMTLALSPYVSFKKEEFDLLKDFTHLWVQPMEFYRKGIDYEDPFRITRQRNESENAEAFKASMSVMPKSVVGLIAEETSPVLRDKEALDPFLKYLKAKKLPFVSPEASINHEFFGLCKTHGVKCLEADYAIQITDGLQAALDILKLVKDLGEKTGHAVVVMDTEKQLVKELLEWLQKLPKDQFELVSLKEILDDL